MHSKTIGGNCSLGTLHKIGFQQQLDGRLWNKTYSEILFLYCEFYFLVVSNYFEVDFYLYPEWSLFWNHIKHKNKHKGSSQNLLNEFKRINSLLFHLKPSENHVYTKYSIKVRVQVKQSDKILHSMCFRMQFIPSLYVTKNLGETFWKATKALIGTSFV